MQKNAEADLAALSEGVSRAPAWSWVVGIVLLACVVLAASRYFDGAQFLRLAEGASPGWLAVALLLQAGTYLTQAEIWRAVCKAGRCRVSAATAFRLSFAKLFVDQTLPSAGFSGTLFVVRALERRGLSRSAGAAGVGVYLISYCLAFAAALCLATISAALRGHHEKRYIVAACVCVLLAAVGGAFFRSGHAESGMARWPFLGRSILYLKDADPRLIRSPRLLLRSALMQLAAILADTATLWVLIRSVGTAVSPARVFGCFMISSMVRSVGLSPGGLGTFEASCILTLKRAGVPVSVALSATLLFRGLSFWLPMIPGLWASRREALAPVDDASR